MDILRNLFGNLTSGLIRLLVAVGILGACYLFIVKPVLQTTGDAIDKANRSFENSLGTKGTDLTDISGTIDDFNRRVRIQIRRSFRVAKKQGSPKKLVRCIERSNGNVGKIKRCTVKF